MVNNENIKEEDFLLDKKVPENLNEEIINKKNQKQRVKLNIFFSFDIVNSTKYKSLTNRWPIILKSLLELIQKKVNKSEQKLESSLLWRIIGDEIVFVKTIYSTSDLVRSINEIFLITQEVSTSLKNGDFFESLETQEITKNEIDMLKVNNLLSIKSTAWLAAINTVIENPYDNISLKYTNGCNGNEILEYIGRDMDTGFRLKNYTQDRRLAISFEIAYLLSEENENENLQIIGYEKLKGVWNENLYPIIWYYNHSTAQFYKNLGTNLNEKKSNNKKEKILKKRKEIIKEFKESFRYDEVINNKLLEKYFYRNEVSGYKLANRMYTDISEALNKILDDRNLKGKLNYYKNILKDDFHEEDEIENYPKGLILHCTVVCCDVTNKKIFIIERSCEHTMNNGKWEFGSPEIKGSSRLIEDIKEYYYKKFNLKIELVLDENREDKQPIPISIYEVEKDNNNIEKGIIIVGRIISNIKDISLKRNGSHKSVRFISEKEINNYTKEEVIPDFHDTLKKVFNNFDKYFPKRRNQ